MQADHRIAALLMMINALIFSLMSTIIKTIAAEVAIFQIMFVSVATQLLFLGSRAFRRIGPSVWHNPRRGRHLLRAMVLLGGMFTGFWAVALLPLAMSTAISFSKAMFVTLLAWALLRERVGILRWAAVVIGFSGILILVTEGAELSLQADMSAWLGIGAAITCAALSALGTIMTRSLSQTDTSETLLLFQTLTGTILLAPLAIGAGALPWGLPLLALIALGGLSVIGNFSMIAALRRGEASALAPIDFTRAVFSGGLGWLVFSEWPSGQALLGMGVIVLGTMISLKR